MSLVRYAAQCCNTVVAVCTPVADVVDEAGTVRINLGSSGCDAEPERACDWGLRSFVRLIVTPIATHCCSNTCQYYLFTCREHYNFQNQRVGGFSTAKVGVIELRSSCSFSGFTSNLTSPRHHSERPFVSTDIGYRKLCPSATDQAVSRCTYCDLQSSRQAVTTSESVLLHKA